MADKQTIKLGGVPVKLVDLGDDTYALASSPLKVISGAQVGTDQAITYANNAGANTQVNIDITKPTVVKDRYALAVYNPSTVTDLTVKIFNKRTTFGGDTRYGYLDTISVPKSQSVTGTTVNATEKILEGLFTAGDVRLVVSNDTALGASDGFSAYARLLGV